MKSKPFLLLFILLGIGVCLPSTSFANESTSEKQARRSTESESSEAPPEVEKDDHSHSFLVGALLYIPNRALDLLDIFRLRLRVGPGFAAGARVTKVAELYAGTYASLYAGLPGPRLRETPKLPVGLESHNGASASVVDATVDGGIGPDYSPSEIGAGFHFAIIGIDFGIDPFEIVDFASGIFTIDLRDDDL